jgi:hypothetical protein
MGQDTSVSNDRDASIFSEKPKYRNDIYIRY